MAKKKLTKRAALLKKLKTILDEFIKSKPLYDGLDKEDRAWVESKFKNYAKELNIEELLGDDLPF